MFGGKEKPAKPAELRKCPFVQMAGSSAMPCIQEKCAMWQDEAQACAFNVIAKAVAEPK